MTEMHLDGNAMAGSLGTVFSADITSASAQCDGCGLTEQLARAVVFGAPMGLIARCTGCGQVLLRYVSTPTSTSVDLRGIAVIRFPAPPPA
ncbi:DUF6510 family protein [Pedococcus bigeumensis]|uniref:DUF6510 family protein n=1 Tax=Pedococcus bigeumensis TaxID=433644 RepID=UPI002FE74226